MFITRMRADAGMDRSVWGDFFFRPLGGLTRSGVRVSAGSAAGLPSVFACGRVLAESFAILPPTLYRPKAGGGRTVITEHWLRRLLAKCPNRFQTPYEWRLMMMWHMALRGNAFNQITANGKGEIVELLPLHPDRMTIETLDNGSFRYAYRKQDGEVIYYRRDEIWHLRGMSDDGYMGLSPIQVAAEAIGEGLSIQSYSTRFFANDAKPGGGWIEYPGQFADKNAKSAFRESWQELQGGENRGKVAVLERGMKFHELALTNKDSQFIEARVEKKKEIAQIFRIPPHKVGILSDATFSNIEQQAIEFWQDTMLPWCELWESSAEYFLLGPDSDIEVEFDMSRMMRGDGAARATRISTLVNCGVMTRNEGREEEGYDPVDGLNEPLRPLNMIEEGEDPPQPGTAPGRTPAKKPPADDADEEQARLGRERMSMLLRGNASRLARRFAKDGSISAALVAEAMAVSEDAARSWCSVNRQGASEEDIAAALMGLAGGFAGPLPAAPPVFNVSVAPAANTINVQPPAVNFTGGPTNVNVEPPALTVNMPAPEVHLPVTVTAQIDASRSVTKHIVTKRLDNGDLVAEVTEE